MSDSQPPNHSSNSVWQGSQDPLVIEAFCPLVAPQRFKQTMRMLISAGDTPEMRAAWPMVAGRILESFCRASSRRLGTDEKSKVSGMDLSSKALNFSTSNS